MRRLAFVGVLAIIVVIGLAVYFFGGIFNVSETADNPPIVDWALATVRTVSIDRHATDQPPANFDDPATAQAGARAYVAAGCVNCHGAPGVNWAKFSEGLRPYPADLKEVAKDRDPAQIFFAVKNGIKFTGMPSFGAAGVSDPDLWAIVAYIKKLPNLSDADFKTWTAAAPQ
jgi:mono/diheme cytochrome c family protein